MEVAIPSDDVMIVGVDDVIFSNDVVFPSVGVVYTSPVDIWVSSSDVVMRSLVWVVL